MIEDKMIELEGMKFLYSKHQMSKEDFGKYIIKMNIIELKTNIIVNFRFIF